MYRVRIVYVSLRTILVYRSRDHRRAVTIKTKRHYKRSCKSGWAPMIKIKNISLQKYVRARAYRSHAHAREIDTNLETCIKIKYE